jgi:hypothetical protein
MDCLRRYAHGPLCKVLCCVHHVAARQQYWSTCTLTHTREPRHCRDGCSSHAFRGMHTANLDAERASGADGGGAAARALRGVVVGASSRLRDVLSATWPIDSASVSFPLVLLQSPRSTGCHTGLSLRNLSNKLSIMKLESSGRLDIGHVRGQHTARSQ